VARGRWGGAGEAGGGQRLGDGGARVVGGGQGLGEGEAEAFCEGGEEQGARVREPDCKFGIAAARSLEDEAAKLLYEIASKSAEFRGLLETYRQAAADTERSLAAGRAAIADANTLADKATATAAAWEKTATEAEKTIALVRDLVAENDAAPGPDDDFSFERLERLAGDTQQALAELRATIADARGLANDPALAAFEQRANAILDGAQDRVDASIDRAARWSLAVLAIAMVLGSGLIVLARKLRGSS
jgi:chromosome segregation ATPase